MGREVRRVPLDFGHPIGAVWPGYLSPVCETCCGDGSTDHREYLLNVARMITFGGAFPADHPYYDCGVLGLPVAPPGPAWGALTGALIGRPPSDDPGDMARDAWAVAAALLRAAGLPETWGECPDCDPDADADGAWTPTDPPEGDGWQMWETTSEGSPISPVFETPEALARWLADTGASSFGPMTATYDQWLAMIRTGWACSAVIRDGVMVSGVQDASEVPDDR